MLSIDEAIEKEKANAEKLRKIIETGYDGEISIESIFCDDTSAIKEAYERFENCAKEHEQRAEWLEELKARREADRTSDSKPFDVLLAQRYSKAIDDFSRWLVKYKIVDEDSMPEIIMDFNEEKLKEGGENEK